MNQHQTLLKPDPGKQVFFPELKKRTHKNSLLAVSFATSHFFELLLVLEQRSAAANQHVWGEQFGNAEYSSWMLPKEQQFHRSAFRNQEKSKPKSFHIPVRYWTIFNIPPIVRYLIDIMNMLSFHGWLLINMLKLIQYIWFHFKKGWNLCLIFLALHTVNQKNKTDVKITAPLYCLVAEL